MPNFTARNLHIAELALQGLPQTEIAKKVGVTRERISQIINQDDICKQAIEEGQKAQIALLPIAIAQHTDMMINSEDERIKADMVKLTYKNTGITPSHTQSFFVDKLLIQQNNALDPQVAGILAAAIGVNQGPDQAEDVDFIDVEES